MADAVETLHDQSSNVNTGSSAKVIRVCRVAAANNQPDNLSVPLEDRVRISDAEKV
jgi:hypothetical protein